MGLKTKQNSNNILRGRGPTIQRGDFMIGRLLMQTSGSNRDPGKNKYSGRSKILKRNTPCIIFPQTYLRIMSSFM